MNICYKFMELLIDVVYLFLLFKFVFILIKQYYSIERFYKSLFSYLRYYNLVFILEILFLFNPLVKFGYIISFVIGILLVIKIPLIKLRFSRRSIFLIILSSILYIALANLICIKTRVLFVVISLSFAHILLLPFETIIKSHYIKKAKERIEEKNPIIIGITGSFGKTSVKHHLVNILSTKYLVGYPKDNNNTLMGICKYINNEFNDEEIIVVELGIDSKNQMNKFRKLFQLDYALITSIGNMHLSTFKSIDNIVQEKMKIKDLLKNQGVLFVNNDNLYLNKIEGDNIIKFSHENINIISFSIDGYLIEYLKNKFLFSVHQKFFSSYLDGIIKVCRKLNIKENEVYFHSGIFKDYKRRNEIFKLENGYLIDNSYNANLLGILDSLELLNTLEGDKIVITGGIIEQGKNYVLENQKLRDALYNHQVIFIGEATHPLIKNHHFKKLIFSNDINHAYKLVKELEPNHILLLCKGENIYLR